MNEQEWVKRWEDREVEFRKIVADSRAGYSQNIEKLSKSLSERQAVILKIRQIPLIGARLVRWAEKNSFTDFVPKEWPKPTEKRTTGTRG